MKWPHNVDRVDHVHFERTSQYRDARASWSVVNVFLLANAERCPVRKPDSWCRRDYQRTIRFASRKTVVRGAGVLILRNQSFGAEDRLCRNSHSSIRERWPLLAQQAQLVVATRELANGRRWRRR